MAAQQKGDLALSNKILLSLRANHPRLFAVDESIGMNFAALESYAEALPYLKDATEDDPASDAAFANLGAAYFKLHRNQEALVALHHAEEINPLNASTQQSLGEVLLAEGNASGAVEAYSAALAISPNDPELQLACASAMVAAGELSSARTKIAEIPNADQLADAQALLAEIDEKNRNYKDAAAHFLRAAQLDPSEENTWALGAEFLRHWTFEAAIHEFESAVTRFPSSRRMKLGLGAAYYGGGRYSSAVPVFAGLLETDANSQLYAELLGMACSAVNQTGGRGCEPLIQYAETHPADAKVNTYAAEALLTEVPSTKANEKARALLSHALAADPNLAEAQYRMGVLNQDEEAWSASIPFLERAIASKPDYAQAHYHLALAYKRVGRTEAGQAEMALEKKYAKQEKDDLNRRLSQITTLIVADRK